MAFPPAIPFPSLLRTGYHGFSQKASEFYNILNSCNSLLYNELYKSRGEFSLFILLEI
jgi:hypothetical protein